nr:recombination protein NinG [uncultured Flavobacterium sp.]
MSQLIMPYKINDCSVCGEKETECRKRAKEYICIRCCKEIDTKKQAQKVALKTRVRGLHQIQKMEGKQDEASRQNLIYDCDYVFSRIVRLRAADQYSNTVCYTCGDRKHFSLHQCGHFQKRGNMALRYDFRNSRVQCRLCNEGKHGNMEVYRQKMEEESPGLPEQLELEAREVYKYSIDELKQLLISLRYQLKPLELKIKK